MVEQKKQHFVPVFYLKNFGQKIYCYDKTNDKIHHTSIKDVGRHDYFYELPDIKKAIIEKWITSPLDDKFSNAYATLLKTGSFGTLSLELQSQLSHFLAFQLCRTKSILDHTTHRIRNFSNADFKTLNIDPSEKDSPELAKKIFLVTLFNKSSSLATILSKRTWTIIENISNENLWTSDHPVVLLNGKSEDGRPELRADLTLEQKTQLHFPLTPNKLLVCYDSSEYKLDMKKLDRDGVKLENYFQINTSGRYLYSKANDFDYVLTYLNQYPNSRKAPHEL